MVSLTNTYSAFSDTTTFRNRPILLSQATVHGGWGRTFLVGLFWFGFVWLPKSSEFCQSELQGMCHTANVSFVQDQESLTCSKGLKEMFCFSLMHMQFYLLSLFYVTSLKVNFQRTCLDTCLWSRNCNLRCWHVWIVQGDGLRNKLRKVQYYQRSASRGPSCL